MLEHYDAITTLADIPDLHARATPDDIALIADGRRSSYAALAERSDRVANALIAAGLSRQSRVAMLGTDSEYAYELLFGCAKAGMVMLSINWRLEASEIAYIVQDSEAELLFITREMAATVEAFLPSCPRVKAVIVFDEASERYPVYHAWRDAHPGRREANQIDGAQAVVQVYTSGTSGRPKGVVLSHGCFLDVIREVVRSGDELIHWKTGDVTLLALPSFHVGGLWFAIHGLVNGATNVIMKAFTGAAALELIEKHAITKVAFVPAMIRFMLSEPTCRTSNLSSVDQLVYGGSPMPRPILERAREVFKCRFTQNYGLSETTNMAVFLPSAEHLDPANPRLKAAGKPLRGVSVRILDPDGRELPPGQVGEIAFKTAGHMLEYWKLPEETRKTLVNGWIHTGDAGYVDEDGFVYVTDRIKDLIISAGENIYPAELERILVQHEEIADVAVIGIPDDRWGEVPIAIVVRRPGSALTKAEVMGFARKHLASFKMLRTVEFIDALPRNPSGKVLKRVLREPYWAGREKRVN
ncbi:long-chain-fatty-acid--CoA ligase [Vitiosangium sp. GDMCC 1.1324]|uniref:long-chain-fatty-acid--CoA ligase n=1 Tax=Vitiosangium sp. (strain GDMCC 1.1324) TaxID=2138576 RepID=UPI000D34F95F|nr:long-chain-fatty-acid--CoA ligase [Vitiosangium sp. GDMCC 1.1324]PTL81637.1 AMP-dependent synthetase [Vitiosangium sp. GDMCC 1.1324]